MSFILQPSVITVAQDVPVTIVANSVPTYYVPGTLYTWNITNLDSYVNYTVSALPAGTGTATVNTTTGVISYTPAGGGATGFSINNRIIAPTNMATVPNPPTAVSAVALNTTDARVTFTAPAFDGGTAITSYTVTASPGGATASGAASPLTITGLTPGGIYTFTAKATNAVGTGSNSAASSAVTMPSSGNLIDVMVVAGGGCSGSFGGGGAGGGGLCYQTSRFALPGLSYTVTVGAGGVGTGNPGSNSVFDTITAVGGGGGGTGSAVGNAGGSGGGGSQHSSGGGFAGGAATQTSSGGATGYGFAGGAAAPGTVSEGAGGGGGGASAVGAAGTAGFGGNGGAGFLSTISGSSLNWAGGGGGASGAGAAVAGNGGAGGGGGGGGYTTAGTGGSNGGNAGSTSGQGGQGGTNTGGGGGGNTGGFAGTRGGSGVVIIKYADTYAAATTTGSPTVTVSGGFRYYRFNGSGTITF